MIRNFVNLSPSEQVVSRARARITLTVVRRDSSSYNVTIDSKDSVPGRTPIPSARDYAIADRAMRALMNLKEPRKKKREVSSTGKRKR